jgi:hypothetical protein
VRGEAGRYPPAGSPEREKLLARLADRARFIRLETVRLAEIPGAGHYTGTFSAAELFASLYYAELRYRADEPRWPARRLVRPLRAGRGGNRVRRPPPARPLTTTR